MAQWSGGANVECTTTAQRLVKIQRIWNSARAAFPNRGSLDFMSCKYRRGMENQAKTFAQIYLTRTWNSLVQECCKCFEYASQSRKWTHQAKSRACLLRAQTIIWNIKEADHVSPERTGLRLNSESGLFWLYHEKRSGLLPGRLTFLLKKNRR